MSQCLVLIHWGATKCGDYSLASKPRQDNFFNSHILSEVEQICDRVAILAQGVDLQRLSSNC